MPQRKKVTHCDLASLRGPSLRTLAARKACCAGEASTVQKRVAPLPTRTGVRCDEKLQVSFSTLHHLTPLVKTRRAVDSQPGFSA
jgi:hypothetical protein